MPEKIAYEGELGIVDRQNLQKTYVSQTRRRTSSVTPA